MTVRVGLNGFGRIGQNIAYALCAGGYSEDVELVAVNDVAASTEDLAYMLRRDSVRGPFPGKVQANGTHLVVNDSEISVSSHERPGDIAWAKEEVDLVIEATGRFRGKQARDHLDGGARKVVISASASDVDAVLVMGVNHHLYDPATHHVISPASCGVNAIAVLCRALLDAYKLTDVTAAVTLAAQGWQRLTDGLDGARHDPRMGRGAGTSIIPHDHVATNLLSHALPELGEVLYATDCAPVPDGSVARLSGNLLEPATVEQVNATIARASAGSLAGLLAVDDDRPVSVDVIGNPASAVLDPSGTQVTANGRVLLRAYFDGESLAYRTLDLATWITERA